MCTRLVCSFQRCVRGGGGTIVQAHAFRAAFRRLWHARFTARSYGNCGRNQLLPGSITLSSPHASITYDWHVTGAMTECFWFCPFSSDRQTKKRTETDFRDEHVYIKTHRQTRVRTETRQDGQDRNRDKRQKTTDENQETRRETRTVVRYGVHCDACCCDGGWVVVWWSCCVVVTYHNLS